MTDPELTDEPAEQADPRVSDLVSVTLCYGDTVRTGVMFTHCCRMLPGDAEQVAEMMRKLGY